MTTPSRAPRIVYLAAGAANMYCGSCLRDNRLAAALLQRGRDVKLIPLYTPLRTDEASVSRPEVYYGGINVFLQQKYALFRHTPRFLDRLLDRPALLRSVGRLAARTSAADLGELTLAVLRGEHGPQRKELDRLIGMLADLQPDLINLPNLMFAGIAPALARAVRVPIVCTLSGEDLFVDGLPPDARSAARELIRNHLPHVARFLATSRSYARRCVEYFGLPADRVHAVPLGLQFDQPAREAEPPADPFVVAYLGRIAPEKGLHVAADAVLRLRAAGRRVRLLAAGWCGDPAYLAGIRAALAKHDAADALDYRGEVTREQKHELLAAAHAFTMPSVFPEAKGLPVLEALGVGVPVVQPARGSFPELIETTGGGLLFDPDAPTALADALARLMDEPELRRTLGRNGAAAVRIHHTDDRMADETWRHYEQLLAAAT